MSAGNWQRERASNYDLQKKVVSATHTIKSGLSSQNLLIENPIDIQDPAADFTMTLGNGAYIGQEVDIVMSSNDDSKTCTLSVTNHATSDPETFAFDAVDEYLLLKWTGTEWVTINATGVTTP